MTSKISIKVFTLFQKFIFIFFGFILQCMAHNPSASNDIKQKMDELQVTQVTWLPSTTLFTTGIL